MRCAGCREALAAGRYVTAGRATYHPECFRCANCGRALLRYAEKGGKPYCLACFGDAFAPRCGVCGEPVVSGRYYEHEGRQVHDACYRRELAGRCDVCGGPLVGRYLTDGWGHSYHELHRQQFPACDACGRLTCEEIGGGGVRLGDGRHLCRHCLATAVSSQAEASTRFDRVRRFLEHRGLVLPACDLPVRLVGRQQLFGILAKSGSPAHRAVHGCTSWQEVILGSKVVGREVSIYILGSLPLALFDGIAAHELGHAWAYLTGAPRHTEALAEGFCNYLAFLVHEAAGGPENAFYIDQMMASDNPAYGKGFRIVRQIAERRGFAALLDHMGKRDDFPLFGWRPV